MQECQLQFTAVSLFSDPNDDVISILSLTLHRYPDNKVA